MFLSVHDLSDLAEDRIMSAEGEAVVPLSDLICMPANADRQEATLALQRLAALEGRPTFFASREWIAFCMQWELEQLDLERGSEEAASDSHWSWKVRQLLEHWEMSGAVVDIPPLSPFIQSHDGMAGPEDDTNWSVQEIQEWIDGQQALLGVVHQLLAAGMVGEVELLAQTFERALKSAQAHLQLAQAELKIVRQAADNGTSEWKQAHIYNLKVFEERRQD